MYLVGLHIYILQNDTRSLQYQDTVVLQAYSIYLLYSGRITDLTSSHNEYQRLDKEGSKGHPGSRNFPTKFWFESRDVTLALIDNFD